MGFWGIYWADKVAGGETIDEKEVEITKITVHDANQGVHRMENWKWERDGKTMRCSFAELADEHRKAEYLVQRDQYRQEQGRPPIWVGIPTKFLAQIWEDKIGRDKGPRSRAVRLAYDKQYDGRNEGKGAGTQIACPLCAENDEGIEHWAFQCRCLSAHRGPLLEEVRILETEIGQGLGDDLYDAWCQVRRVSGGSEKERIWRGLWTYEARESIRPSVEKLSEKNQRLLKKKMLIMAGRENQRNFQW